MTDTNDALERRYRRMLTWYPLRFRERHGEELLAVLLDDAREGQRFPAPRDTVDLLAGGLAMRLRERRAAPAGATAGAEPTWGDTLAAASVHGLGPMPVGSWTLPRWLAWIPVLIGVVVIALGIPYVFFDHALASPLAGPRGEGSAVGAVGRTTYHGLSVRPAGNEHAGTTTLDLRTVIPRVAVNTAGATVTVLLCTGEDFATAPLVYGTSTRAPGRACRRLSAFHAGTIRLGTISVHGDIGRTTGVLIAVTPHHAGVVRVNGADVTYRQGIRHGDQHVGMRWTLHVP